MKKLILWIIGVAVVAGGAFLFFTRPASAPSENIVEVTPGSFVISQDESVAEFRIDEVLNDEPFTAVGTTSNITGEALMVELDGVRNIGLSEIRINARTFKTDDERRDGAIARLILKAEDPENEFIIFAPTDIVGVPESPELGVEYDFTIVGDLTVSGVTKQVEFAVVATVEEDVIQGRAEATLERSDFGLVIPNIPFVASVEDEFAVSATLVARRTE